MREESDNAWSQADLSIIAVVGSLLYMRIVEEGFPKNRRDEGHIPS